MSAGLPISSAQAVRVLFRMAVRRFFNRWQSMRLARKKPAGTAPAKRTGTGGKSAVSWVYPIFFFVIFTFNGFNFASRSLAQLAQSVPEVGAAAGQISVSEYTYKEIGKAQEAYRLIRQQTNDTPAWQDYRKTWDKHLDEVFTYEMTRESVPEDEQHDRVEHLRWVFMQRGPAGFSVEHSIGFMGPEDWPKAAREPGFINCLGLLTGLFLIATVMMSLGLNNKDLGQVEWSFEWLYTLPVSARALYFAQLVSGSLLNPFIWMFLLPFMLYVFLVSSWSCASLCLALLCTAYYLLLAGALAMLIEVGARKFLSLSSLKNLQAVCTVFGTIFFLSYLACGTSVAVAHFYVRCTASLPSLVLWQPFSLPAVLLSRHAQAGQIEMGLAALFFWAVLAAGSVFACEWMTRQGLIRSVGPYQGVRKSKAASASSQGGRLAGIAGKEMRLLMRDRNIMVQVFIGPLIVIVFYLVTNSAILAAAQGNFHHAATLAFCVGAYGLTSSAMQILNHEKGTLWQLFTFPRSLLSILVEKTMVWAVFAFFYATVTLAALVCSSRDLHSSAWVDGFLALYGVILYAFIAGGIGVLATNVLETTPRARMRADMMYLYLLLIGMYAFTIYTPSYWTKLAQLVLSTLLAFALWQKAKDRLPYLLDPQASPPPTISLSDGLIAALAFFVMQGFTFLILHQYKAMPEAMEITLAYSIAGLCIASLTLYTLWRHKIPGLWSYLGFITPRRGAAVQSVAIGFAGGLVAAAVAAVYLHVLTLVPSWESWREDAASKAFLSAAEQSVWFYALAIVAAPLCEEFIFRGLIFRGLRRSLHPALAIVASAALFALVHPPVSVIPVFGLGVVAAFCFERTGLLLAPIVAHMTYNTCVILLNR